MNNKHMKGNQCSRKHNLRPQEDITMHSPEELKLKSWTVPSVQYQVGLWDKESSYLDDWIYIYIYIYMYEKYTHTALHISKNVQGGIIYNTLKT